MYRRRRRPEIAWVIMTAFLIWYGWLIQAHGPGLWALYRFIAEEVTR